MTWDNAMDPNTPYTKLPVTKWFKIRSLVCKALGSKASECNIKSNSVCYLRIVFVVYVILTNFIIMYGVLTR